jgi:hypothetical protein
MGKYNGAVVTTAGEGVIAQAITGTELTWTVMRTSSVAVAAADVKALTALTGIEQTSNITDASVYDSNVIQVSARFSNTGIATPYYIRTVGIYGKLAGGSETLIAVMTAVTPDEIPVYDADAPSAFIFTNHLTVQDAESVTMSVNDAGTATVADLNRKLNKAGGDLSDTVAATATASSEAYPIPAAGDSFKVILGKIRKFFTDIKAAVTDLTINGRTITYTKADGTTGTLTTQDTTYGVVSKNANGLAPKLPNETSTTKYLRQDGTWQYLPLRNNATTTEEHYALDARMGKTLQNQINSINNSLPIIVYAGSVVNDSITIPSRWAIIYVNVWIANNSSRGITFTILRGFMVTGNGYTFRNGYYESTANCALCEVGAVFNSDGSITLRINKAFLGGTDYVSTSSLSVSYILLGA